MSPYRQPAPRAKEEGALPHRTVRGAFGHGVGDILTLLAMIVLPIVLSGRLNGVIGYVVLAVCNLVVGVTIIYALVSLIIAVCEASDTTRGSQ